MRGVWDSPWLSSGRDLPSSTGSVGSILVADLGSWGYLVSKEPEHKSEAILW